MKTMKKIASLALALLLTVALAAPAFAVGETGSITIKNTAAEQDYTAYKILDLVVDSETAPTAYLYTVPTDWASFWTDFLKEGGAGVNYYELTDNSVEEGPTYTQYVTYIGGASDRETAAQALTAAVKAWLDANPSTPKDGTAHSNSDGAVIDGLPLGYYFISSTVGSVCLLDTNVPDVTINEKNELPTVAKTVNDITFSYGDTITFTLNIKVPSEQATNIGTIKAVDIMSKYLTFIGLDASTTNGISLESNTTDANGDTVLTFAGFDNLRNVGDVTVVYTAQLNAAAINTDSVFATAISNTAKMTYTDANKENEILSTTDSVVNVYTYQFDVVKTNSSDELLDGATFSLWDAPENGNQIDLAGKIDNTEGIFTATDGKVTIKGLAAGTYYLQEEAAPEGYNEMTSRATITITPVTNEGEADYTNTIEARTATVTEATETDPARWEEGGIRVINYTGAELPSTGGIGTTIFYIVGGLLVVGAVVLLVTRKRAGEEE